MRLNNDIYLAPIIPVEILKITGNGKPYFCEGLEIKLADLIKGSKVDIIDNNESLEKKDSPITIAIPLNNNTEDRLETNNEPLNTPYFSMALILYSEHVGVYLQLGPKIGEIAY